MKLIQITRPALFTSTLLTVAGFGSAQGSTDTLVEFVSNTVARAGDVNSNFQLVLRRAVEASDMAGAAMVEASSAGSAASDALTKADEALTLAGSVQGLASSASASAATAIGDAAEALAKANSVEGLASSADSKATEALSKANSVEGLASSANASAAEALAKANSVEGLAASANTAAEAAQAEVSQLSMDALPLLTAIAVDGMDNVGIGRGPTFGASQDELLQIGDFLSMQDNYIEIRTVGGSSGDFSQGVKLRSSNPGFGFTIEHTDALEGLNVIRHELDSIGQSALYIDRRNGFVGLGTESPSERLNVIGNICATGFIGSCSDRRFKADIEPLEGALDTIEELRGVSYDWRADEFPEHEFTTDRQVGFIAQEVAGVLPHMVSEGSDGYLSVDYGKLTPVLVEAVKEQQEEIESLRSELEVLRSELAGVRGVQAELVQVRSLLAELAAGR